MHVHKEFKYQQLLVKSIIKYVRIDDVNTNATEADSFAFYITNATRRR